MTQATIDPTRRRLSRRVHRRCRASCRGRIAGNIAFNTPPAQTVHVAASDCQSQPSSLGIGKSVVIDLPRDIKDVLVADPKIANAVVRSSRRAYIIGTAVGQTNVFFFDADGKQIAGFDIAVTRDLNGIRAGDPAGAARCRHRGRGHRRRRHPDRLAYRARPRRSRPTTSPRGLLGAGSKDSFRRHKIVNAIVVRGRDQVMLKVTVAEVERDVIKQLGINLSGALNYGTAVVNFNNTNPFSAYGQSLSGSSHHRQLQVGQRHVAGDGAGRRHSHAGRAEPDRDFRRDPRPSSPAANFRSSTAISCYAASAGSTVPTCQPSIDFKKFGVSLNFTPVVLSEGRISLKVMTEVSDLSTQNSLTITEPGTTQHRDHPVDPHPPRRNHGGNSVRRLAGHGRHDPEPDQAGDQRPARPDGASHSRPAVQEPRLHQSADRADGAGDALCRARGRAEGLVAARRRFRRSERSRETVLLGRLNRIYGVGGNPAPTDTLPRQIRLHPRLMRPQETTMQTVRTTIAGRRAVAGLVVRAAVAAGCALVALRLQYRPAGHRRSRSRRPIIACGIRSRCRNPTARSNCSSAPIAASSTPTQRAQVLSFGLGWKREATGGIVVERPVGSSNEQRRGRRHARDRIDPGRERRAAAKHRRAAPIRRPGRASPPCASAIRKSPRRPGLAACGPRISARA